MTSIVRVPRLDALKLLQQGHIPQTVNKVEWYFNNSPWTLVSSTYLNNNLLSRRYSFPEFKLDETKLRYMEGGLNAEKLYGTPYYYMEYRPLYDTNYESMDLFEVNSVPYPEGNDFHGWVKNEDLYFHDLFYSDELIKEVDITIAARREPSRVPSANNQDKVIQLKFYYDFGQKGFGAGSHLSLLGRRGNIPGASPNGVEPIITDTPIGGTAATTAPGAAVRWVNLPGNEAIKNQIQAIADRAGKSLPELVTQAVRETQGSIVESILKGKVYSAAQSGGPDRIVAPFVVRLGDQELKPVTWEEQANGALEVVYDKFGRPVFADGKVYNLDGVGAPNAAADQVSPRYDPVIDPYGPKEVTKYIGTQAGSTIPEPEFFTGFVFALQGADTSWVELRQLRKELPIENSNEYQEGIEAYEGTNTIAISPGEAKGMRISADLAYEIYDSSSNLVPAPEGDNPYLLSDSSYRLYLPEVREGRINIKLYGKFQHVGYRFLRRLKTEIEIFEKPPSFNIPPEDKVIKEEPKRPSEETCVVPIRRTPGVPQTPPCDHDKLEQEPEFPGESIYRAVPDQEIFPEQNWQEEFKEPCYDEEAEGPPPC